MNDGIKEALEELIENFLEIIGSKAALLIIISLITFLISSILVSFSIKMFGWILFSLACVILIGGIVKFLEELS